MNLILFFKAITFHLSLFLLLYTKPVGPHSWIRWKKELELFADLCYFGLTTVCGKIWEMLPGNDITKMGIWPV